MARKITSEELEQYDQLSYNCYNLRSSDTFDLEERMEKLDVSFIESKTLMYVLKPIAPEHFESGVLKNLHNKKTITTLRFHSLAVVDQDENEAFDFGSQLCNTLSLHLPKLQTISVQWMAVKNFQLAGIPSVTKVSLVEPHFRDDHFEIKLPNLKELSLRNTTPDAKKFTSSLINCPRIEIFSCHTFWSLDSLLTFYLPSCTDFTLRGADLVKKLHLYAPRLTKLNLDDSSVEEFKLIQNGVENMMGFNLEEGKRQSQFHLSVVNTFLSARAKEYLVNHSRVIDIEEDASDYDRLKLEYAFQQLHHH